jgi:diaminohydroxyphosphoribosylaminopyrimidine deaminase/5-amino-6-(5-phosphoribosylamino)uracil reductase
VKKVVVACSDPNPLVAGKGVQILKKQVLKLKRYL